MALMKSSNVPNDAVMLDEIDAITYAWDFVKNWESLSDTWALRYAPAVLGGVNAFSGILINNHYRNKLKLGSYGFFSSVIPMSILPGILTPLFHRHLVSTRMLLMKDEACPICYEMRSAAVQISLGVFYPMVLGSVTAMMLTHRYATARIPELLDGPRVVFKFWRKITRPFNGTLAFIAGFQIVSSAVLTYCELKNNISLRSKILEIENKIAAEEEVDS